jgi:hypothetical protein
MTKSFKTSNVISFLIRQNNVMYHNYDSHFRRQAERHEPNLYFHYFGRCVHDLVGWNIFSHGCIITELADQLEIGRWTVTNVEDLTIHAVRGWSGGWSDPPPLPGAVGPRRTWKKHFLRIPKFLTSYFYVYGCIVRTSSISAVPDICGKLLLYFNQSSKCYLGSIVTQININ